jgi:DNA polymerase-3 subunit epsilon
VTWTSRPWCGFDLETTGTDLEASRIVTAAVVEYDGGRPARATTWVADPGVEIPAGATAIHGYTTAAARASGRPAPAVVEEVVTELVAAVRAGYPLVVMNGQFDFTVLDRECARYGLPALFDLVTPYVLDVRVLDKRVDRYRRGGRRLEDLCATYKVVHGGAHEAAADAVAACDVTAAIVRAYPWLARVPLADLHEQQIRWAADQQAGLREHFATTPGKTHLAAGVREDWPYVPPLVVGWGQ